MKISITKLQKAFSNVGVEQFDCKRGCGAVGTKAVGTKSVGTGAVGTKSVGTGAVGTKTICSGNISK